MKPAELMRVLNTAGRGTVLTETRLRRHRNRAGYTIGDARTVNLFRYAAWLTIEHFAPREGHGVKSILAERSFPERRGTIAPAVERFRPVGGPNAAMIVRPSSRSYVTGNGNEHQCDRETRYDSFRRHLDVLLRCKRVAIRCPASRR